MSSVEAIQAWRLKGQRYSLKGNKCEDCGQPMFPPRPKHAECAAKGRAERYEVAGKFPNPTIHTDLTGGDK
jgi:uncharacterized OB-fold protein